MDGSPDKPQPPGNPVPPPPAAATEPAIPDLYWRIGKLRYDAVGETNRVRSLTSVAGIFTIIVCAIGGLIGAVGTPLMLLLGFLSQGQALTGMEVLGTLGLGVSSLLFISLGIYAVYVLSTLGKLYYTYYERTTDLLRETDLALMITTDPYWQQITDKLNEASILKFAGKSAYKRIEEHLSFCAFHIDTLVAISRGKFDQSVWQLRREETAYRNQRIFQQRPWVYWVGGCLTLLLNRILFPVPVLIVVWGSRFVASRGALVAICEYLLKEDPNALPPHAALRIRPPHHPPVTG